MIQINKTVCLFIYLFALGISSPTRIMLKTFNLLETRGKGSLQEKAACNLICQPSEDELCHRIFMVQKLHSLDVSRLLVNMDLTVTSSNFKIKIPRCFEFYL